MNEYEIDVFEMHRSPQVETHRVSAHSAADALTCFKVNNRGANVVGLRCVERPTVPDAPSWAVLRCFVCGGSHSGLPCTGTGLHAAVHVGTMLPQERK